MLLISSQHKKNLYSKCETESLKIKCMRDFQGFTFLDNFLTSQLFLFIQFPAIDILITFKGAVMYNQTGAYIINKNWTRTFWGRRVVEMIISGHFQTSLLTLEGLVYWVTLKVLTALLGLPDIIYIFIIVYSSDPPPHYLLEPVLVNVQLNGAFFISLLHYECRLL